jgi:hypothetical protein
MNLLDAVFQSAQMQDGSCICCKRPFHPSSEAVIVQLTPDFRIPEETKAQGFEYFLEKDGVLELLDLAKDRLRSREAKVELIAYYADFDAYPAWLQEVLEKP